VRIFLDTNVLVSAVATRGLCADVLQAVLARHELILGEAVLEELQRVLPEKFKLSHEVTQEVVALLRREATVIGQAPPLEVAVRDPNDLPVLEQAVAGAADFLVTGDLDLLEIAAAPVVVVSPRGLWERLRSETERTY
jgi:putative PIN family toxin of toxin-antitoxin system